MTRQRGATKTHIADVCKNIRQYLRQIQTKHKNDPYMQAFSLNDLICRVGELESCIIWNVELKQDPNSQPNTNRLCRCYDYRKEQEENETS